MRIKIVVGLDMNEGNDSKVFQATNFISVDSLEILKELFKRDAS